MKKLCLAVKNTVLFYISNDIAGLSAQLSYYMLFTFFPVLLFGSAVLARLVPASFSLPLANVIPAPVRDFAFAYIGEISEKAGGRVMFLSVILTLYSLTRYVKNYRNALGEIYGRSRRLNFIADWVVSFVFSVFLLLLFYLAVISVFVTDNLLSRLGLSGFVRSIWFMLRFLVIAFYGFFVVCAIHYAECGNGRKFRDFVPGAIAAVTVWGIISAVFSYYAGEIADYSAVYGSIGNVIMLLVWLNLTNTVLLMCAVVNIMFEQEKG